MKKTILWAIPAIVLCACNNVGTVSDVDLCIDSISVEQVAVDAIDNCSYTGFSGVRGDSLYYFDRVLAYLYSVSTDGRVGSRQLGLGKSSKELPVKNAMQISYDQQNNAFDIIGGTYDMYIYGSDGKTHRVDMKPEGDDDSFESSAAYTFWDEVLMCSDNDYVYYNIFGNNEKVDVIHCDDYFEKAAVLMKVSKSDGEMLPIGRYSDFYVKNKQKVRHLPYYYFDADGEGGFYFTYQVDSLVYHYDKDFKLVESFGRQGRDMCVELSDPGSTEDSFVEAFMTDRDKVGRYYWIKKCGEYLFRSYFKSQDSTTDGLQIYKDGTLVGDVDVPHGFRVSGLCGGYYVTSIAFNDAEDGMNFFKFKIK